MKDTFHKLVIGVSGPGVGYAFSISTTEIWLRVLSLVVGISVGVASLISICFSIRKKYKSWRNEKHSIKSNDFEEPTTTI